jgi:hypothetical protein
LEADVPDPVNEETISPNAGRDLVMRSMRKVLIRRGYEGDRLERRIEELLQMDFPRLTAAMMNVQRPMK